MALSGWDDGAYDGVHAHAVGGAGACVSGAV